MLRTVVMSLALLVATTATASAQTRVGQDLAARRDDVRDLVWLRTLSRDFDLARARGDFAALRRIDDRVRSAIRSELNESRNELRRDNRETANDRRAETRDLAEGRVNGGVRQGELASKDAHSAATERFALTRCEQILRRYDEVYARMDAGALNAKRGLLNEMLSLDFGELARDNHSVARDLRAR